MTQTLEQQRAQNAWEASKSYDKELVTLAKGLPALIMNSGLLQVLAFANEKGGKHETLAKGLCKWLAKRRLITTTAEPDLKECIEQLMEADPQRYRQIHAEALAWLKWLRHMAAARKATETAGE